MGRHRGPRFRGGFLHSPPRMAGSTVRLGVFQQVRLTRDLPAEPIADQCPPHPPRSSARRVRTPRHPIVLCDAVCGPGLSLNTLVRRRAAMARASAAGGRCACGKVPSMLSRSPTCALALGAGPRTARRGPAQWEEKHGRRLARLRPAQLLTPFLDFCPFFAALARPRGFHRIPAPPAPGDDRDAWMFSPGVRGSGGHPGRYVLLPGGRG